MHDKMLRLVAEKITKRNYTTNHFCVAKEGKSYRFGNPVSSYLEAQGGQVKVRYSENNAEAAVDYHSCKNPEKLVVTLVPNHLIDECYGNLNGNTLEGKELVCDYMGEYQSGTIKLAKKV